MCSTSTTRDCRARARMGRLHVLARECQKPQSVGILFPAAHIILNVHILAARSHMYEMRNKSCIFLALVLKSEVLQATELLVILPNPCTQNTTKHGCRHANENCMLRAAEPRTREASARTDTQVQTRGASESLRPEVKKRSPRGSERKAAEESRVRVPQSASPPRARVPPKHKTQPESVVVKSKSAVAMSESRSPSLSPTESTSY